jgi:uncharacterized protein YggE
MRHIGLFILAGWLVLPARSVCAQAPRGPEPGGAQVSASGRVHLQRTPTHLRMFLQISGRGKTLEEALATLKERREAVAAQLEKLGAEKASIVFASPSVDESVVQQQKRMEMMLAQRLRSAGGGAKKAAKPAKPPVSMVSLVTVQWPLKADSTEKLLLAADELREKVKAAELISGKDVPKLSPEEQEVAEEMAAEMARNSGYGNSEEEAAKSTEPRFVFLARLAAADRQKALADAFAKAKAQAAELAKAAGAQLGPLTSISGDSGGANAVTGYGRQWGYSPYGRNEAEYMQQLAQATGAEEQHDESVAMKPDGVGFDFSVNATFSLR